MVTNLPYYTEIFKGNNILYQNLFYRLSLFKKFICIFEFITYLCTSFISLSVEVCPVGTFSSMIHSESCIPCDLGYYQDQEGQTKCKPCPATTNTTVTAAPSISYCKGQSGRDLKVTSRRPQLIFNTFII